jgi:hypothetical protein
MKPGVLAGEYLALYMWAEAVKLGFHADDTFNARMKVVLMTQTHALLDYFNKTGATLQLARAVAGYRPHEVLYNSFVLEELGRLSVLLIMLQHVADVDNEVAYCRDLVVAMVNTHPGCTLPVLDGQSIDISLVILALMGCGDRTAAKSIVQASVQRLGVAVKINRYLPVDTDDIEDALSLESSDGASVRDFFKISTLTPALATFAAFLGCDAELSQLRADVLPQMKGVTLERWFPTVELETLTSSGKEFGDVGVSRALVGFGPSVEEEATASVKPFTGFAARSDFKWHGTPFEVLVVLSARWHRHPIPTWYVKAYAEPKGGRKSA